MICSTMSAICVNIKREKIMQTELSYSPLFFCLLFCVSVDHCSAILFASLRSETELEAAAAAVLIVFTSILLWLIELIVFVDTLVNYHECST